MSKRKKRPFGHSDWGVHVAAKPLMQVVQEAIYQARWIDAFGKDASMASDEQIAKTVVEAIGKENSGVRSEAE